MSDKNIHPSGKMTMEQFVLVELTKEFNENMRAAMMLTVMHADTAADAYAWAAARIRNCVERVFTFETDFTYKTATDVCPSGEFSYTTMEVL